MKLSGSYEISLDKESIWKALNDPEILKKSIPGCEEFKKNSDTSFIATATNKIGPFNATFVGTIELKDLKPHDSYKIVAQGNSSVGFVNGEAVVKLEENNGITKLIYIVDAKVGGKIAQVGSRLIDMAAKKMAGVFFGKFSELLSPTKTESLEEHKKIKANSQKSSSNNKKIIILFLIIAILLAIFLIK